MAAEGPAAALAPVHLLVAHRAASKALRCSIAPIHIACEIDGRSVGHYEVQPA